MKQMLQICCKNNNIYKEFPEAHFWIFITVLILIFLIR